MDSQALASAAATTPGATLDLVVVGGGGHVGLPLSLAFAQAGLRVGIYDISQPTLDTIAAGNMPFREVGAPELLAQMLAAGRLELSSSPSMLGRAEHVILVIGTPIDEFMHPSMAIFENVADQIAAHLNPGTLVILRSTVYPGTSEYLSRALAARGADVSVSFCPERIAEGNALKELRELPNIIGADDVEAGDRTAALFAHLSKATVRTTTREAELAKLFTNSWRYLKFAIANQFMVMSQTAGIDYGHVLAAMRTGYPRAADVPSPGFAAGPCLLKDTMQLAALATDHFALGHAAVQANEGLPAFVVDAMKRRFGSLHGKTVGLMGMSFKPESDDVRSSLSYKLRKLLTWEGATVLCTDPYVQDARLMPLDQVIEQAEILVIGVPHRAYKALDLTGREVVDIWGALGQGIHI
jgi:UDP-N-acetyl-D-mannosaminuronic acid dehydrogenase